MWASCRPICGPWNKVGRDALAPGSGRAVTEHSCVLRGLFQETHRFLRGLTQLGPTAGEQLVYNNLVSWEVQSRHLCSETFRFHCGKCTYQSNGASQPHSSVHFSDSKDMPMAMPPSPPPVSRTLHITELCTFEALHALFPSPILLFSSMNFTTMCISYKWNPTLFVFL